MLLIVESTAVSQKSRIFGVKESFGLYMYVLIRY